MARNKMMFSPKTVLLLVFMLHVSNIIFVKAEDSSADSSTSPYLCLCPPQCDNPCQPFPPSPPYPFYGAPPPPSPSIAPPPPPSQVECPPPPVQCCENPPAQGSGSPVQCCQNPPAQNPPAQGSGSGSGSGPGSPNLPYYNYSSSPPLPTFHRVCNALLSILLFLHFAL